MQKRCVWLVLFISTLGTYAGTQDVLNITQTQEIQAQIADVKSRDQSVIEVSAAFRIDPTSLSSSYSERENKRAALAKMASPEATEADLVLVRLPIPDGTTISLVYDRTMIVKSERFIVCHEMGKPMGKFVLNWTESKLTGNLLIPGRGTFRLVNIQNDIHIMCKMAPVNDER